MSMVKGIDVSSWQGNIQFHDVKASGIKFVIIRAGYGNSASQRDKFFEQNYQRAKAVGLDVGVYWFSYATSAADAKREAQACLEVIKGKKFEYPIYFDLENRSQFNKGMEFCNSLVTAFCDTIEKAGYYAGLYVSRSVLGNYVSASVASKYALWIAQYAARCTYSGDFGMWQYSESGNVPGTNTNSVDMDYAYVDYPSIIKSKGLNGYPKPQPKPQPDSTEKPTQPTTSSKKTISQIAQEVLYGYWGTGESRKQKLEAAGYNYNQVQAEVNKILQDNKPKTIHDIAIEVLYGYWGTGEARKQKLEKAGYNYNAVQAEVNKITNRGK